ncbi:MAG: polysaccharide deacetylase family protein [Dehalococcoidia bacterium]|nr:polysaccharide deacetylase family protein [Dehalococcoidia bacterium]
MAKGLTKPVRTIRAAKILGAAALVALLCLPALAVTRPAIGAGAGHVAACVLLSALGFALGSRFVSKATAAAGAVAAPAAAWLLTQTTYPGGVDTVAFPFGLFVGLAGAPLLTSLSWKAFVLRRARQTVPVTVGAVEVLGFSAFWVGSTNPHVTWLGDLKSHGDRSRPVVALTFDDGPNPDYSLEVARILDERGVKGTFFEVGNAAVERPDITAALVADGQIVANHSYLHDAVRYLDPRYPELDRAERALAGASGVCPAFFRPPHGAHTPFMWRALSNRGMTMITWDVSAQDWVETDPDRLAANILAKVKPGSIILLHDGLDGNIPADRSVVVKALPAILDGLQARGLRPVTVPELLHRPAYLSDSECDRFR